jgi:glycosyltransferase involved in cell wall biosynthesis
LNICVVTSSYPRFYGDYVGSFVHEMCASLHKSGDCVVVVAPHAENTPRHEVTDGVEVHRFEYGPNERLQKLAYGYGIRDNLRISKTAALQIPTFLHSCAKACSNLAKTHEFDVIFAHWALPMGLSCVISKKKLRKPVAVFCHGSDVFQARGPLFQSLAAYTLRNSDLILTNSMATRNRIEELGISRPIHVIHMGVELNRFAKAPMRPAAASEAKTVLFVGRLRHTKGISVLVRAMNRISKEVDCKLQVVGEGPIQEELVEYAAANGLRNRVEFKGAVPKHLLPELYSNADLFVLPSFTGPTGETEGLGVSVLEAMAAGKTVVAGNSGGIPDLIQHNVNGVLTDTQNPDQLAEEIVRLLRNDELRNKMGEVGRRMAQQYSWDVVGRRIHQLLAETAQGANLSRK